MAAPLTIEQMIMNHNIGVNISDADSLEGHKASEFSLVGHKHSASDINSGTMGTAYLPSASTTAKGIVQLSSNTDSTDATTAATPYAVNQVKALAQGKADAVHKHAAADINAGTFPGRMVALSEDTAGVPFIRNIIVSTIPPTSSVGKDGDLYFIYKDVII
jgi:hypothetical protein